MAIEVRSCVVCNKEFSGSSSALYCSNKCKQAKYRGGKLNSGFIYKLISKGKVVYVGQSRNERTMKKRIYAHSVTTPVKVFDSSEWYEVIDYNLNEAEASEILKQNPIYNKILPSNGRYLTVKRFTETLDVFIKDMITKYCDVQMLGDCKGAHHSYVDINDTENLKEQIKKGLRKDKLILANKKESPNDR